MTENAPDPVEEEVRATDEEEALVETEPTPNPYAEDDFDGVQDAPDEELPDA